MALTPEEQAELEQLEAIVADEQAKQQPKEPSMAEKINQVAPTPENIGRAGMRGMDALEEGQTKLAEGLSMGLSPKETGLPAPFNVGLQQTPGKGLRVNPVAATTIAMLPDIASTAEGIYGAFKAAPAIAKGAGSVARKAMNPLRRIAETITGPGEKAVMRQGAQAIEGLEGRMLSQQEALSTLPKRTLARGQELATAKKEYGTAINKAEEVGGFGMKHSPQEFIETMKDPKALQDFSKTMRKIGDTPVADLVKTADVKSLQHVRKFGQMFREIGPKLNKEITREITANIKMGAGKSTEALTKIDETFGKAIEAWSKTDSQIKRLGSDAKSQKAAITQSVRHTKNAIKLTKAAMNDAIAAGAKRDMIRGVLIKYGLGSFIGGAAAGAGWQLMK